MATIDWEQFNENFQYYDQETISEVIENFFDEIEDRLINLEKNIAEADFKQLSFNAHSLKSVIGNFMAPKPFELCRKLEDMAKQNSKGNVDDVFSELKPLIYKLIEELKGYLQSRS